VKEGKRDRGKEQRPGKNQSEARGGEKKGRCCQEDIIIKGKISNPRFFGRMKASLLARSTNGEGKKKENKK